MAVVLWRDDRFLLKMKKSLSKVAVDNNRSAFDSNGLQRAQARHPMPKAPFLFAVVKIEWRVMGIKFRAR